MVSISDGGRVSTFCRTLGVLHVMRMRTKGEGARVFMTTA
jgi:hypothetical protein